MHNKAIRNCWLLIVAAVLFNAVCYGKESYAVVDTGQKKFFGNSGEISKPRPGKPFYGQDAQYQGNQPSYRDNGDGTVSDLVTGLMWQKNPGRKKTLSEARKEIRNFSLAGHNDWRIPTVKELYSLIMFYGIDPPPNNRSNGNLKPFINTGYFTFRYGKASQGDRLIDSQYGTCTIYTSTTMHGNKTMFGVNFADGRIKGYPVGPHRGRGPREKTFYFMYVRGNREYGKNKFADNQDGTITDKATGLMWMQHDSGYFKAGPWKQGSLDWQQALKWAEELKYAGHDDWRLPNAKELQSIVDYSRSPKANASAAIDPLFKLSTITDEGGRKDYPFYWTGTTHCNPRGGQTAAYIAFGEALGWMRGFDGRRHLLDVHGAGAQRSDPKSGDPSRFPYGRGPQGDVIRIYNFVLAVRGGTAKKQ